MPHGQYPGGYTMFLPTPLSPVPVFSHHAPTQQPASTIPPHSISKSSGAHHITYDTRISELPAYHQNLEASFPHHREQNWTTQISAPPPYFSPDISASSASIQNTSTVLAHLQNQLYKNR